MEATPFHLRVAVDIREVPALYRQNHDITIDSLVQLENVAKLLSRFAGGKLDTNGLTVELANRWLCARKDDGLSPATIKGNRTSLLMLWREAHDLGAATEAGKVRTVKVPAKIPVAFTLEEVRLLIAACAQLKGTFRRVPIRRRIYFSSLFNADYDTALRLGDLLSIERSWIWPGGYVSIVQSKTRQSHRVQLRAETLAQIDECMADWPGRALIWPEFAKRKRVYEYVRRLVGIAGIRKGTTKWIRRSSASYVEAAHPGCGAAHLGHKTAGLAERYYFDPMIVRRERPLPPAIG
jgi:integrase